MEFSMDSIADLLGSLSDSDLASLREAAQTMFENTPKDTPPNDAAQEPPFDPEMLLKISRLMQSMQSGQDERTRLIASLKPYLSAPRRKKADEAMQFLRMLDLLPMLGRLG